MIIEEEYIKNIVKDILTEEVAQNKVIQAIKKRHEVSFTYNNGDGNTKGKAERITVQPVAYGTTTAGNPCFRAYQINGSSESHEEGKGVIPGWRLFILDNVVDGSWKESNKVFPKPPMFNEKGDKTMANVFMIADFSGTQKRYERGGLKKFNQKRREENTVKDPYYYFKKNLAKSRMAPDYVLKNIEDTAKSRAQRNAEWDAAEAELRKGNNQSIYDMSQQKDFGDNGYENTSEPQMKGNNIGSNNKVQVTNKYNQALQNGPVYKNDISTQSKPEENQEDKNIENEEY